MYPDSSEGLNKETTDAVYFFTVAFEPFNSFSAHQVHIWNKTFPTAEHAFQWKKFSSARPDIAEEILTAGSPEAAKQISIEHKKGCPPSWHDEKLAVMEEILRAKTEQHTDVQEALERSGNREIIENSPVDSFWGNGPNNDGENMMGKLWMKIRDSLTKQ